MSQGIPIAAVSPQYGLAGADLSPPGPRRRRCSARRRSIVDDAAAFAGALEADFLAGLPVIAGAHRPAGRSSRSTPCWRRTLRPGSPRAGRHRQAAADLRLDGQAQGGDLPCTGPWPSTPPRSTACYDDPDPPVVVNQAPWSHSLGANAILQMVLHRGGTLYIDAGQPVAGRHGRDRAQPRSEIAPTYHNMVPAGWDLLAGRAGARSRIWRAPSSAGCGCCNTAARPWARAPCDRIQAVAVRTVGERISFASGYGATETGPTATNVHWPNQTHGPDGPAAPRHDGEADPRPGPPRVPGRRAPRSRRATTTRRRRRRAALRRGGLLSPGRRGAVRRSGPARGRPDVRRPPVGEFQAGQRHLRQRRRHAGRRGLGHRRRGLRRRGLRRGRARRGPADLPEHAVLPALAAAAAESLAIIRR